MLFAEAKSIINEIRLALAQTRKYVENASL